MLDSKHRGIEFTQNSAVKDLLFDFRYFLVTWLPFVKLLFLKKIGNIVRMLHDYTYLIHLHKEASLLVRPL